ncbi:MAG: rRNA maturation RNase YbeY [Tenericutes bacterium]|jgi:probable rRNA maturation factor|nr:rRNA maturation RNase YbeY [Bacilli bacterium]MDD3995841.1 rRNA maturation RNase YbeY [Bacilli bacterium]MDD4624172.1 rRNA maturation RNase YbeY [Bacilli bacterium]NLV89872.1 rRNA maturation RNase YbeY [Mycoplasmatota bacterium]
MNNINIFYEIKYRIDFDLKDLLEYALKKLNIDNVEFNVIFIDNNKIKEINKEYRNIDKETDVISFALEDIDKSMFEGKRLLGDIYISYEKSKEQAIEYNHSLKREISFLSIHGLLHLLGYDHMIKEEEIVMFKLQEDILNEYGIKR